MIEFSSLSNSGSSKKNVEPNPSPSECTPDLLSERQLIVNHEHTNIASVQFNNASRNPKSYICR